MNIKFSHVRLLVEDYQASLTFYRDILGLPQRFSDEDSRYGEFDTGTVTLAIFDRQTMADALGAKPDFAAADTFARPVLIFGVDDVDKTYQSLQAKGVQFIAAPTDQTQIWTIRTAHLTDPDGNLIRDQQSIEAAQIQNWATTLP